MRTGCSMAVRFPSEAMKVFWDSIGVMVTKIVNVLNATELSNRFKMVNSMLCELYLYFFFKSQAVVVQVDLKLDQWDAPARGPSLLPLDSQQLKGKCGRGCARGSRRGCSRVLDGRGPRERRWMCHLG